MHRLFVAIRPPETVRERLLDLMEGLPEERALMTATASVFEIVARTAKRGADELTLEQDASSISTPMAMVQMRRLMHPGQIRRR